MVKAPTHAISVLNDEKSISNPVLLNYSRAALRLCEVVSEAENSLISG